MSRIAKLLCGLCIIGMMTLCFSYPVEVGATETDVMEESNASESDTEEENDEIKTHSQLVIDSYEIAKGAFERSAECTLRVHIRNIDENNAVTVGQITMYSSYVYMVFGKTNQITFGEVKPGESIFVDFEVNLDNIVSGPNPIEFELGWTDENTLQYTNMVNVSPVLLEKVGFEISSVKMPETVYGSKNTTISVSYENIGAENLQNVYMILDGDLAQGVQVVELEDISAKKKEMVDYSLELLNMGENHVSISFRYEDRNGTEYTTEAVEQVVVVTDKNYISPAPQETGIKELLEANKIYVVCVVLAVLMCIPFLIGLIKKGGKK